MNDDRHVDPLGHLDEKLIKAVVGDDADGLWVRFWEAGYRFDEKIWPFIFYPALVGLFIWLMGVL